MAHVFISYKRGRSTRLVKRMCERLQDAGFETWIDMQRLRAGEDWREDIDQAIRNSLALIVVLTPEAVQSQYVTYEWAYALGVRVPVIPIMYQQTTLHPRLIGKHYLDFTSSTSHPWDTLIERLQEMSSSTDQ